jgi:hypothetical protein
MDNVLSRGILVSPIHTKSIFFHFHAISIMVFEVIESHQLLEVMLFHDVKRYFWLKTNIFILN